MFLTSHWPIIFSITVSWLILTISLGEIQGKISKSKIRNVRNKQYSQKDEISDVVKRKENNSLSISRREVPF